MWLLSGDFSTLIWINYVECLNFGHQIVGGASAYRMKVVFSCTNHKWSSDAGGGMMRSENETDRNPTTSTVLFSPSSDGTFSKTHEIYQSQPSSVSWPKRKEVTSHCWAGWEVDAGAADFWGQGGWWRWKKLKPSSSSVWFLVAARLQTKNRAHCERLLQVAVFITASWIQEPLT